MNFVIGLHGDGSVPCTSYDPCANGGALRFEFHDWILIEA